jgi:serine/threonine-protein kinase
LSDIDHPNLVRIKEPLTNVGNPIMAVAWLEEYLDGEDLTDLLSAPWPWSDVRQLGLDLARGLEVLHERSVVHRDLSPNNVRRLRKGSYVIMDPGYARHLLRSTLTLFGQPGTPGFLSPEHLSQTGPLPASDVFCVGILMFAALTGGLPYPLTADMAAYQKALRSQAAPALLPLRPDIPPEAASLVEACLDLQPARRFLDGGELAVALEAVSA